MKTLSHKQLRLLRNAIDGIAALRGNEHPDDLEQFAVLVAEMREALKLVRAQQVFIRCATQAMTK